MIFLLRSASLILESLISIFTNLQHNISVSSAKFAKKNTRPNFFKEKADINAIFSFSLTSTSSFLQNAPLSINE